MRSRVAIWAAWSSFGVTMTLMVAMTLLSVGREPIYDTMFYGLFGISLATVGALIAARHPGNPIGWLFCVLALYGAFTESAAGWGYFAAERGLPAGEFGEWIILWSWVGDITFWTVVLMLFPGGYLPSRRWRIVLWVSVVGCILALPGQALDPDLGPEFIGGTNPFVVEGIPTDLLYAAGMTLIMIALLSAIFSLIVRFRSAGSVERQQLKWFALAAGCMGVLMPFAIAFWFESVLVQVMFAVACNGLPIAVGIAILKHRLYDIDVIVNRALVYGSLTAMLVATYFGSVVLLQYVFRTLTGGDSQLAIVASTLAIAALFVPLRRRIQRVVDRRFYRNKYDGGLVLEDFSKRLRDETELDVLSRDLIGVVRETMQPSHVYVWLRPPEARSEKVIE